MRNDIDRKLIAHYAIREAMGLAVMGMALFWSAGQIDWWPAWASIGVMLAWTVATALVIFRAIGAPIFFMIVSLIYFKNYSYTSPLQTAIMFVGFVIAVDFFVVALVINRSLDMFASVLGTWLPFALIFTSAYLTGLYVVKTARHNRARLI